MAGYDTSIRVKTDIDAKKATVQLASLENRIVKTADKISSLRSKIDALKDVQIPTQEYTEIQKQIEDTEKKINNLIARQEKFLETGGKKSSSIYQRMQYDLEELRESLPYLKSELEDLVKSGKAFTLGSDTEEFAKLVQQLQYSENDFDVLIQKHEALELKLEKVKSGYGKLGDTAKKAFAKINSVVEKAGDIIKNLGSSVKNVFSRLNKSARSADKAFTSMGLSLKNILKYGFGIRSLYALVNKLRSAIKEGYENLYNYNDRFKNSINSLKASTLTLKNALAAAFRPLVDIAIPYIQKVIDYMSILLNSVGQFMAAITGQKTYTRAIKQTTAAIEEQNKAQNKQLSSLDNLNNLTSGSGSADAAGTGQMFEEVPVDDYFKNLADRVKDLFSKLFAPLKEAWNREGKFVMDSWKYALGEIKDLAKSIGADFLEVWQQEKTIKIFEDILHIIGDIGLAAGNLAHNFRLAWEENETGKRILEGVRDIIGVIIANIRHAADVTADWSARLNFTPLLTAIKGWVESLVPVFDALSGIVTDFYEKVLLPLGKWTIKKGLPELFQVLTDFNNKVDWESLRAHLAEFWEHLEPFAETIGEGLIIFIERVSDAVANFLNSDTFVNFLHIVEDWMNSVTPEDVADAIEKLVKALIAFKIAALGLSAIKVVASIIGSFVGAISKLVGAGKTLFAFGSNVVGVFELMSNAGMTLHGAMVTIFGGIGTAIAGVVSVVGGIVLAFTNFFDMLKNGFSWVKEALMAVGIAIAAVGAVILGAPAAVAGVVAAIVGVIATIVVVVKEHWAQISELFMNAVNWVKEKVIIPVGNFFVGLWNGIKQGASALLSFWTGIWNGIKNVVSSVINTILGWINTLFGWLDKLLTKIDVTREKSDTASKWVGASSGSNSIKPRTSAMSLAASLQDVEIPGYATGQVIPRTMKQHLAYLGDNNKETEVVSPLSTMKQAMVEAMVEAGMAGGNSGGDGDIVINIDGREVFRVTRKQAQEYKKRTGSPAFG